ncbi:hypothetical protein D9757_009999 [Collybiopsis confluens]|uniref:ZIP-like iron-zinc transporter n=1 Tax=Collybiopsis confluens TaxID=2823264 RepID=A0A8H5LVU4_9AGAR|nr:hypothetical protein D9757_009999 [Collybiopsis confluens]
MFRRDTDECGTSGSSSLLGLRIASIFIIGLGSVFGALFPVLARRSKYFSIPKSLFDFAKYFGSGVIIATSFIHLLSPAIEELSSPCLPEGWSEYPYALALCLLSIFAIFIVELVAFRWGTAILTKIGIRHDAHGHDSGSHTAHGPEGEMMTSNSSSKDVESSGMSQDPQSETHQHSDSKLDSAVAQVIGVAVLEFGVVLHSVLIGLTLAVNESFKILFVVLVFHQTFEGLGLGSRLAFMSLPSKYNYIPVLGALLFGITTPVGIAVGLGLRTAYSPNTPTALMVSGILDSLSAGILIYTGLVELLAHEFLFNKEMMEGSNTQIAYALTAMLLGCGLMALLGKWA